jgi:tellurite resistance-related uncharacterized protein
MKDLPQNKVVYKTTKIFDQNSIPKGILNNHSTKAGTWGKINIVEGFLLYTIQSNPIEEILLSPDKYGVVEPEVIHKVTPKGDVKFFVEFLK